MKSTLRILLSHGLTALGVILFQSGIVDPETLTELAGAAATILGIGVNLYSRFTTKKQNNQLLSDLADLGVYSGKLDGVIGPVARQALTQLASGE